MPIQACSTLPRARGSAALLPLRGRCHHDGLHVARPVVVDEGWARRAQAAASPVPSRAPAPSHARQEYDLNTTFCYTLGTCQAARCPVCLVVGHGSPPCRNKRWIAPRASLYTRVTRPRGVQAWCDATRGLTVMFSSRWWHARRSMTSGQREVPTKQGSDAMHAHGSSTHGTDDPLPQVLTARRAAPNTDLHHDRHQEIYDSRTRRQSI